MITGNFPDLPGTPDLNDPGMPFPPIVSLLPGSADRKPLEEAGIRSAESLLWGIILQFTLEGEEGLFSTPVRQTHEEKKE